MAKRVLSSTLKNLKFMQRAIQKEEKTKVEEDVKPDGNFVSSTTQNRRCIVIMEGDPHPAVKGRMSFQSFNPTVDKLNEEAINCDQPEVPTSSSGNPNGKISDRENGFSQTRLQDSNMAGADNNSSVDLKRKQAEMDNETESSYKSQRNAHGKDDVESSLDKWKGSHNKQKREKLDWSVLRPPKGPKRGRAS